MVPTIDDVDTVLLDGVAVAVVVDDVVVAAVVLVLLRLFSFALSVGVDCLQTDSAFGFRFCGNNRGGSSEEVHSLPPVVVLQCLVIRIPHYNPHAVVLNNLFGVAVGVAARMGGSKLPFLQRR